MVNWKNPQQNRGSKLFLSWDSVVISARPKLVASTKVLMQASLLQGLSHLFGGTVSHV